MYCTKCGNKVSNTQSYCTNCGNKLNCDKIKQNKQDDLMISSLIIGILSIIGTITCSIFILPLAIFGLVLGLKSAKKLNMGVILNLIAIVLTIIFFVVWIVSAYKNLEMKLAIPEPKHSSQQQYDFNEAIEGTWYLDKNNKISRDYYISFNQNNTFVWNQESGKKYRGTYKEEYKTEGTTIYYYISLTCIDEENQTENFELIIELNNQKMTLNNLVTNEVQNYKKENMEVY